MGGGRHRPRRRVAHLEDADQHLSRQSRLQGREHPAGARIAAAGDALFGLKHPLVVGLTTNPERLIQIRRNRLLSLNQAPETDYVDIEAVNAELAFARRMFADNGWPVIDVTRRSIEETALAIVKLCAERLEQAARVRLLLASQSATRRRMLEAAGVPFETVAAELDEEEAKAGLVGAGFEPRDLAEMLAEMKAKSVAAPADALVIGADQVLELRRRQHAEQARLARRGAGAAARC